MAENRDAAPHVGADRREILLGRAEERADEAVHRAMVQVVGARTVAEDTPDPRHAGTDLHFVGGHGIGPS